jgi:hypothetical protein
MIAIRKAIAFPTLPVSPTRAFHTVASHPVEDVADGVGVGDEPLQLVGER